MEMLTRVLAASLLIGISACRSDSPALDRGWVDSATGDAVGGDLEGGDLERGADRGRLDNRSVDGGKPGLDGSGSGKPSTLSSDPCGSGEN